MTLYKEGMINIRMAAKEDGIALGNGKIVMMIKIMDIRGTICDNQGTKLNQVRMPKVQYQYLLKMMYNLMAIG